VTAPLDLTPLRDVVAQTGPGASGTQFVAVALQAMRRASSLTPTEFAKRANLSLADVGLAELGTVPWHVLHGYLTAADADDDDRRFVRELWEGMQQPDVPHGVSAVRSAGSSIAVYVSPVRDHGRASGPSADARARRPITPPRPNLSLWPDPSGITDALEFQAALAKVKNSTGASYARLAMVADGLGYPLPRTTLHNLCTRKRLPVNAQVVSTFVTACGADEQTAQAWVTTWQRLRTASGDAASTSKTPVKAARAPGSVIVASCEQAGLDGDVGDGGGQHGPGQDPGSLGESTATTANVAFESVGVLWSAFGVPLAGLLLFFLGLFSGLFLG
jgi:hypothetical protein